MSGRAREVEILYMHSSQHATGPDACYSDTTGADSFAPRAGRIILGSDAPLSDNRDSLNEACWFQTISRFLLILGARTRTEVRK